MRAICPWLGLGAMLGGVGCVGEVADKAPAADDTGQDSGGTHTGDTPDSGHTGESGGGDSRDTEDTGHTGDTDSGYMVDSCWQTGHDPADTALPGGYERGEWLADADAVVWGEEGVLGEAGDMADTVEVVGDLNADGSDDLFVSARDFADQPYFSGYGMLLGAPLQHDMRVGDAYARVVGETRADGFEAVPVGAGDLDGDGMDDLLIVAPNADPGDDSFGGMGIVIYGPIAGEFYASDGVRLLGTDLITGATWGIGATGDMEENGLSGFIISLSIGDVYYYDGPVASTVGLGDDATATMFGIEDDGLGYALGSGEDTTGDGIADVVVASAGTAGSGGAMVCLVAGPPTDLSTIPDIAEYCAVGDIGHLSVAMGADVTGDSLGDVFIGRPFVSGTMDDREQILVMEGGAADLVSFEDAVARLNGPKDYGAFGNHVDTGMHADGSGFVVTNAYSDASSDGPGEVFVVSGPMSGVQEMEESARVVVDDEADQYLFSGTGGDLTGDEIVDVVVGDIGQSVCGVEELGAVYILAGRE